MFSLLLIVLTTTACILTLLFFILHKIGKNAGTVFLFRPEWIVLVVATVTVVIMMKANQNAIGNGELVAYVEQTPLYQDSVNNEYFILSSAEWDLSRLAYRCVVKKEDAEKIASAYELQKKSNKILDKYCD